MISILLDRNNFIKNLLTAKSNDFKSLFVSDLKSLDFAVNRFLMKFMVRCRDPYSVAAASLCVPISSTERKFLELLLPGNKSSMGMKVLLNEKSIILRDTTANTTKCCKGPWENTAKGQQRSSKNPRKTS